MKLTSKNLLLATLVLSTGVAEAANLKLNLKKKQNLPRIIGGIATSDGERPWMASLQMQGEHFCGGSVIEKQWILTAAHCVEDIAKDQLSDFAVRVNFTDLKSDKGEKHQVEAIYAHLGYAQGESTDVAVLKLKTPISDAVTPVKLATNDFMTANGKPGAMASVSGWGNTSADGEEYPHELKNVDVPVVSNETCNTAAAYGGQVKATEICAGYAAGGKDSCQGDSGGPLVIKARGEFIQAGVVSWGDGCAQPEKYGVYARVTSFIDWIDSAKKGQVPESNPTTGGNTGGGEIGGGEGFPAPEDGQLYSGDLITGVSGDADGQVKFTIDVPENAKILWIDIEGDNGDADLYLKLGSEASVEDYDYAPHVIGSSEHIMVEMPEAGTWHIMLHGYEKYENLEMMTFVR